VRDPEEVFAEFFARFDGAVTDDAKAVFREALAAARAGAEVRP
jgi:hypothetical protein